MNSHERIDAAVALEIPDRVPLAPLLDHWAATYCGITNAVLMSDGEKRIQAVIKTATDFHWDMTYVADTAIPGLLKLGVPAKLKLPGEDLPENSTHQFEEKAYMNVEDYDVLISEGLIPFLATVMSRIYPDMTIESALIDLAAVSAEITSHLNRVKEAGMVPATGFMLLGTALEFLSYARGITNAFMDIRRYPEKIRAAAKRYREDILPLALDAVRQNGVKRIFIGLSRSSPTFIPPKVFADLCLPDLEFFTHRIIEEGITPLFHCDTDWTKCLHFFARFPRARCIMELDSFTDIFNAKKVLGDTMVIKGDVPSTLTAGDSKQEVLDYCKRLIKEIGKGGGFILSTGCSIPNNAKPENISAMTEAIEEWGYYS